ncbi:MAG: lycopene cyclase domain protein [Crocinitomicaceae bacterium]|jgi:lycopene cyclase domain-containing protein|nr:lycopene cyclase domain protein [Crocinitomicaceae bacterium]
MSFDRKVAFYKSFGALFPAIFFVGIFFLTWDMYFTRLGVWGFTPAYLQGIYIYNLPLEECLFFVVVPFACLFIHEVLKAYLPNYDGRIFSRVFACTALLSSLALVILNWGKWYSVSAGSIAFFLILYFAFIRPATWFRHFALTYTVVLLPFLLVNGVLTGAVTEEPVVWYNPNHFSGLRMYIIPVEDLFYNLDLLLPVAAIFHFLKHRRSVL